MDGEGYDSGVLRFVAGAVGLLILINLMRDFGQGATAGGGGDYFPGVAPAPNLPNMLGLPYVISEAGRQTIKDEEIFSPMPYADGGGQSVGWGHQIQPGENFSYPLSFQVGEAIFESDIAKVEATINSTVAVPLDQDQVDAIGDFIFRIGAGNWAKSQLLADLNAGNYAAAATDFSHFVRTNGQVSAGLVQRAANEQQTFSGGAA